MPINTVLLPIRHHVTTFKGSRTVVDRWIAVPHVNLASEIRMEPVNGSRKHRLFMTGWPVKGIQSDAAIDPAGGIAGVKRVR
jgi:hypothetical protein